MNNQKDHREIAKQLPYKTEEAAEDNHTKIVIRITAASWAIIFPAIKTISVILSIPDIGTTHNCSSLSTIQVTAEITMGY